MGEDRMDKKFFGVIVFLLAYACSAQEYLNTECFYRLENDEMIFVYVTDTTNDGTRDIIAATKEGGLYVFNYGECVNWEPATSGFVKGSITDVAVLDLNGDGVNEIIVSIEPRDARGEVAAVFGVNKRGELLEDWNQDTTTRDNKAIGFSYSIHAADLDGDGLGEIVLGCKNNKIYVLDGQDQIKWTFDADNPVYYVYSGDIDSDGSLEVVGLSKKYGSARIYALDKTGKLKWDYAVDGGVYMASKNNIEAVDLEGDGKLEVVVGGYNGVSVLSDGGELRWTQPTQQVVTVVRALDLDGDGVREVLAGANPFVYAFEADGRLRWKGGVNTTVSSLFGGDLDGDGSVEVLAGASGFIHVFDKVGRTVSLWGYKEEIKGLTKVVGTKDASANSIAAADLNKDGKMEVVAGFGWEEDRLDKNFYFGNVQVFSINMQAAAVETTSLSAATTSAPATEAEKPATTTVSSTTKSEVKQEAEKTGSSSTTKIALIVVAAVIIAGAAITLKKRA